MPSKDTTNKIVAAVTFVVIIGGVVSYSVLGQQMSPSHVHMTPLSSSSIRSTIQTSTVSITSPSTASIPSAPVIIASSYKDGQYAASGNYMSPGGPEHIDVNITLKAGVIIDSLVTAQADLPISKRFQMMFADACKQYVVGKNINDIDITKISGSSLTPLGFNDALAKIKAQAHS